MMKHEWRKQEKELYLPKAKPTKMDILAQKFFVVEGKGNPNGELFAGNTELLYGLSYAVRMMPKNGYTPEGYFEYTVYPLEGLWSLEHEHDSAQPINKDELIYKIMIRQPEFVSEEVFKKALEIATKKKPNLEYNKVKLKTITDGLSVQIMHTGSYDSETESFNIIDEFIANEGLTITTKEHREIYLSDPRKTEPEKMKTVLRRFVK